MVWMIAGMILTFDVGAEAQKPPEIVSVCMYQGSTNWATKSSARPKIRKIFEDIGIAIRWTDPSVNHCAAQSIAITFLDGEPPSRPETLAFARPFEGRHIFVFINRINNPKWGAMNKSTVLAYVVAHEIGHLLMGTNCHSTKGIMKAYWTGQEYSEMFSRGLAFLPRDVDLILSGMDHWRAQVPAIILANKSAGGR